MPRKFINMGCLAAVQADVKETPTAKTNVRNAYIIHSLRVEDTFFKIAAFAQAMGMSKAQDLVANNAGVTMYSHRITSDAVALGVFNRWGFTITKTGDGAANPRFGEQSRII